VGLSDYRVIFIDESLLWGLKSGPGVDRQNIDFKFWHRRGITTIQDGDVVMRRIFEKNETSMLVFLDYIYPRPVDPS